MSQRYLNVPNAMFLSWLTLAWRTRVRTACESVLSSQEVRFAHKPKRWNPHQQRQALAGSACNGRQRCEKTGVFHKSDPPWHDTVKIHRRPVPASLRSVGNECRRWNVAPEPALYCKLSPADRNEEIVKKITLNILLMASVLAWAGPDPNPAEYTINIHVSSSRLVAEGNRTPTCKG